MRVRQLRSGIGALVLLVGMVLVVGCSDGGSGGSAAGIDESFANPADRDVAATTAAWGLDGTAGLHSGYGFGGNGADGSLTVSGSVVLDSSATAAAAPGPDGLVEWNFSRLHVEKGGTLQLTGAWPIRLKVMGQCLIEGALDASGQNGANAPAGTAWAVGRIAGGAGGPGGGDGGISNYYPGAFKGIPPELLRGGAGFPNAPFGCSVPNVSGNFGQLKQNCGGGTGGNRGIALGSVLRSGCSGNGGGHATAGQVSDALCQDLSGYGGEFGLQWAWASGPTRTDLPTAGAGGGAGGNAVVTSGTPAPQDDIVAGSGGGAGGAFEIECAGAITVAAGGAILSNGGNGGVGHSTLVGTATVRGGYGGAGAGGSIWLSATSVAVENGATLAARGGVGNPAPPAPGAAGNGGDGYAIIRDLGGNPTIEGTVTPPAPAERYRFEPATNCTSQAVSRWYAGRSDDPNWHFDASDPKTGAVIPGSDLRFTQPPASGQTVFIDFQAAPDKNGVANPDPLSWHPSGNSKQFPHAAWESDLSRITAIGGFRWLRFRVRFDLGELSKSNSLLNQIVIKSIRVRQ